MLVGQEEQSGYHRQAAKAMQNPGIAVCVVSLDEKIDD